MTEDSIRQYFKARDELDGSIARLSELRNMVCTVCRDLTTPSKFPQESLEYFPTAKEIGEAISNFTSKHSTVMHHWSSLSADDQNHLNAPPSISSIAI